MTILMVREADVKIGLVSIKGLIDNDGNFYVGFPQICEQFTIFNTNTSRDFKTLLGEDLTIFKTRTEGTRNNFQSLSLPDYEKLVMKLDRVKNNIKAAEFRDLLAGLSLQQLFCDAFGIQFETEERQKWLCDRMESISLFWNLTEAIKETVESQGKELQPYHFSNPMDAINRGLFGKPAKKIREELGVKTGLTRDNFGRKALRWLTTVQEAAAVRVRKGVDPVQAVKDVITALDYHQIDYKD